MRASVDGPYTEQLLDEAQGRLSESLGLWGCDPASEVRLLTVSENATFLLKEPDGHQIILRLHRSGYHTPAEINSELDWITALRSKDIVHAPQPLALEDGGRIATIDLAGETRHVVGFEFLPGDEPDPEGDLTDGFRTLGAISARLHSHVMTWSPPPGFVRKTWDFDAAFGATPLWGDWRDALGLTSSGQATLESLAVAIRDRLEAYGQGVDRFGLIHADLRLANLLADGDQLRVIDFDDCGFSWFAYDFAAAISFLETKDYIPDLQAAWVAGYRSVAPLDDVHVGMIPTFIMFRRLLLTAWIASHAETETAAWAGHAAYTDGTVALAESFLSEAAR